MEAQEDNQPNLNEIRSEWEDGQDSSTSFLRASLNEYTAASGRLTRGTNSTEIFVDMIHVPEEMRGKGIATKLLTVFAEEAKKKGATYLFGDVTNEASLKTFAKVFGADKLELFNYNKVTHERTPLETKLEEASESLKNGSVSDYGVGIKL